MTPEESAELATLLEDRLLAAEHRAMAVGVELAQVRGARADSVDDEHDPEGSTLSSDWSRLDGLARAAAVQRVAIEEALDRMEAGTYGACIRCGLSIGLDRLRARPEAVHCIECARELER
ncbi:TraR/DksA family transcriptional regulator [Lacisediminihabitans changchengi]|uniref:TraR/DksA family transcriptional regulator n=1 Tax=Lacisediminihabitans changchengi TaxID=2787634 RepID=A0A934VY99_9MICO|nr:TraR/DksA family transcriptional regulator [Lacisediminihabitans changchengi]MBK4347085.1 TraR/DksA family transcriptional regulator [Lacisediminihabitans changchengi]MBK4347792.1 TraR/DksA family transcriptional regulator [Lacisediminihabitans changchengi]